MFQSFFTTMDYINTLHVAIALTFFLHMKEWYALEMEVYYQVAR